LSEVGETWKMLPCGALEAPASPVLEQHSLTRVSLCKGTRCVIGLLDEVAPRVSTECPAWSDSGWRRENGWEQPLVLRRRVVAPRLGATDEGRLVLRGDCVRCNSG
jgi:hypothetical protein